jgi:molybdopterin-guanine dinucleotide biosynthesis protein A
MQGGGRAQDKAMLLLDEETMLQRALRTVREACGNATILCGTAERGERFGSAGRTLAETVPGRGPLGGLEAALGDASEEWLLVMPVDLPLLPAWALRELIEQGTDSGPGVACFDGADRRQPLPVVIHRAAHSVIAKALAGNERKLMPVLQRAAQAMCHLGLCVLPAEEFASELDVSAWFTNVNTPDDYRAAQELLAMGNGFRSGASE